MGIDTQIRWHRIGTVFVAAVLSVVGVGAASANGFEITKAQVDGAPRYDGAATRIFRLSTPGREFPVEQLARLLGDALPAGALHCERLDDPPGPEGTLLSNGLVFRYVQTGNGDLYFDWSANAPVAYVSARVGDQAYVYAYAGASAVSDVGLRGPGGGGAAPRSFDFCFRQRPPEISRTTIAEWRQGVAWGGPRGVEAAIGNDGADHAPHEYGRYRLHGTIEISAEAGTATVDLQSFAGSVIFAGDGSKALYRLQPYDCVLVPRGTGYGVIARCRFDTDYAGNSAERAAFPLDSRSKDFLAPGSGGVNTASATVTFLGLRSTITTGPAGAAFAFPQAPTPNARLSQLGPRAGAPSARLHGSP